MAVFLASFQNVLIWQCLSLSEFLDSIEQVQKPKNSHFSVTLLPDSAFFLDTLTHLHYQIINVRINILLKKSAILFEKLKLTASLGCKVYPLRE